MRIRGPFSHVREWPPLTPKRTQGALPLDPAHCRFAARRAARAAQCKCGVHGFAMNPCESLPLATAPYYRGARVTFAWRQTACRMRHCCARRIVETGDRRKLGCTSTRWTERHPQGVCRIRKAAEPPTAAQQRMIGAEANRIATLMRQRRAQGSAIGKHCSSSSCSPAMSSLSLGVSKGGSLLRKRIPPLIRAALHALLSPSRPTGAT